MKLPDLNHAPTYTATNAHSTHEVLNQPRYQSGPWFQEGSYLMRWLKALELDAQGLNHVKSYAKQIHSELMSHGALANQHLPEFISHNRQGERVDFVAYHPSYHHLMASAIAKGHTSLSWQHNQFLTRAGVTFLHNYADPGSGCPLTMTHAGIAALNHGGKVAKAWQRKLMSRTYDPSLIASEQKGSLTLGMAMTEKQGGSDVRQNTTRATCITEALDEQEAVYQLTGHKWFCSAPMCDGFLMLAQTEQGLGCFLVPRIWHDGSKNGIEIQRLKNKVGNRSNASSEIELKAAHGYLIGAPDKGVNVIIEMVALTRVDCMLGSSALMMQGIEEAMQFAANRQAFGKHLIDQPLMQNVLADLALEAHASLGMSLTLANAFSEPDSAKRRALTRLGTAIGKYWLCKRAITHSAETMEALGGIGYVEDSITARLYKEAPVNSIWEGSGNVQCLDVLRALYKEPALLEDFTTMLATQNGKNPHFDEALAAFTKKAPELIKAPHSARVLVEQLAILWQASTLLEHTPIQVANAFINARLVAKQLQFGGLINQADVGAVLTWLKAESVF